MNDEKILSPSRDRVSIPVSTPCKVFRHVISGSRAFVFLIRT